MSRLAITLLGGLDIRVEGRPVTGLGGGKTSALLAYLAIEQQSSHSRETLASLFWPELPLEAARRNLRQALFQIRTALETDQTGAVLLADRERVRFNTEADHWLDVPALLQPLEECPHRPEPEALCPECLEQLRATADLYRGELLAGLTLPEEMEEIDEWLQARRELIHQQILTLLERLTRHYEQAGHLQRALRYAHRYTELDPFSEGGHATLMRLLARTGQPNAALAQYESCRRLLERELAVPPGEALDSLFEEIRSGRLGAAPSQQGPASQTANERRFLVALACRFSVDLPDPEDQAEHLRPFLEQAREVLASWGGYTDRSQAGSLVTYFSFPSPDEHAVARALETARALQALGEHSQVQLNVGIHAGTILYSPASGHPDTNGLLAQEALHWAERGLGGGVQLSPAAGSVAQDRYQLDPLPTGPFQEGWRLAGPRHLPAPGPSLTEQARERLEQLQARGGPCLLSGDPGSGKSRILAELIARTERPFLVVRCQPWESDQAFAALKNGICQGLGLSTPSPLAATGPQMAATVRTTAGQYDLDSEALAAPFDDGSTPFPPERMAAALGGLLAAEPFTGVIVEDLQWADSATRSLLTGWASGTLPLTARLIATARPGTDVGGDWHRLPLKPEPDTSLRGLLQEAGALPLDAETRDHVLRRAEGNPGLTLALARERGRSGHELPPALLLRMQSEWAHLGPERYTARQAAVWGESFTTEDVARGSERDPGAVARDLQTLRETGLLLAEGEDHFRFRDRLTREALYESLPRSERRPLHARYARSLQDNPGGAPPALEAIAQHWGLAGEAATASHFWLQAAQRALAAGRPVQAGTDARHGLAEARSTGASQEPGRSRALWLVQGQAEMMRRGPLAPRAAGAFQRALLGCTGAEDEAWTCFQARWALWLRTTTESGHPAGREAAHELLTAAGEGTERQPAAHLAVGVNAYWLGRLGEAAQHLRQACDADNGWPAAPNGRSPQLAAQGFLGLTWWQLGFPDRALEPARRARAEAWQGGAPADRAWAAASLGLLHFQRGEPLAARETTAEALQQAEGAESAGDAAIARLLSAWAAARIGDEPGLSQLWKDCETVAEAPWGLGAAAAAWAAEALVASGRAATAMEFVRTGLERGGALGERASLPDLYRLQGQATAQLQPGQPEAVEIWLQRALDTACNQSAPALALRCATALGWHWHAQGRCAEARCLVNSYARGFTEGLDTADLLDAHQLQNAPRSAAG